MAVLDDLLTNLLREGTPLNFMLFLLNQEEYSLVRSFAYLVRGYIIVKLV